MSDGGWQMSDGRRRMPDGDDGCEVRSGGCGDGQSGETTPQAPSEDGVASGELNRSGQWPMSLERVASGEWWRVAVGKANPSAASRRKRSAGRRKMCKTKPIRNQRKFHCRLRLNRPCPSLPVENEAKVRGLTLHAPRLTPPVASECEVGETAVIEDRQD